MDREHRLECIRLAASHLAVPGVAVDQKRVMDLAQTFYDFVRGQTAPAAKVAA